MLTIADRIDRLNSGVGRAAAWAALFVVLVQFLVVVLRYAFGQGSIWLTEAIVYGHGTLIMLAAAWTLLAGGHVRVDVFYADASPRIKAWIDLLGALLLLLPFMLVLAWFAFTEDLVGQWAREPTMSRDELLVLLRDILDRLVR